MTLKVLTTSLLNVLVSWLTLNSVQATQRPIIGILTQEIEGVMKERFPDYDAYIAASYVKAVESAGARVVPIAIAQNEDYYRHTINSVNGILLPGGGCNFKGSQGYYAAGKTIYEFAIQINQLKFSYPILGICLGLELLLYLGNNGTELRRHCHEFDTFRPLKFLPQFEESLLFKNAPEKVLYALVTNITVNYHRFCIRPKDMEKTKLSDDWKILTTSKSKDGKDFVSSVEHKEYPFVGLQFHPEKNVFEWMHDKQYPRGEITVLVSNYFYRWLINQAQKNNNSFTSLEEEEKSLIYNYQPVATEKYGFPFEQIYLFKFEKPLENKTKPLA